MEAPYEICQVVSEEMFKECGRWTDDRRMDDGGLSILLAPAQVS